MWTTLTAVLCAAAALFLGLRLLALHRELHRMAAQLNERTTLNSNALIRLSVPDRALGEIADQLNASLAELREWKVRLEHGDHSFNEALVMWAHDLRTPLTAVLGYFELLEEEPQTEAGARYLDALRRRLRDVEDITEELFAFALLRADRDKLKLETIDLREQTEAVAASFYDAYQQAGVEAVFSLEEPVPVIADAVAVKRILYNLLSNALKHGSRQLRVSADPGGILVFTAAGTSLDPVAFERLSGHYFSVSSARGSQGVGLAVVRSLTEKLGGIFSGRVTGGTLEIRIELPAAGSSSV